MTRTTVISGISVAALSLGLLVGCSGTAETGNEVGPIDQVTLIAPKDTDSFDPHKSVADAGSKQLFDALYDTLVRVDTNPKSQPGTLVPALAASWEMTPTTGEFKIKENLSCADGSPLTASGIARSLKRIADPKTGTAYASRVFGPNGVKRINGDDSTDTVKIELNKPYSDLISGLTAGYIVCPAGLSNEDELAKRPASTGPYTLTSAKRGYSYKLELRKEDAAVQDLDTMPKTINVRVVADDTTRANLLDSGEAEIVPMSGQNAVRLEAKNFPVEKRAANLADSLLFNQASGRIGSDRAIRSALAKAVDAASYTKAASFDTGKAIDTVYTPNMECYAAGNGALTPEFDLAAAKAELSAAGYGPGKKELKLRVIGFDTTNSGPEYIADALRAAGVTVELRKASLEDVIGIVFGTGDWDVMVYEFSIPTVSPYGLVVSLEGVLSGAKGGPPVQNKNYQKLAAAATGADGGKRCELWSQAERALLKSVDVKPLMWPHLGWFHSDKVTFEPNGITNVNTRTIRRANS